jgi:hypothetical protein
MPTGITYTDTSIRSMPTLDYHPHHFDPRRDWKKLLLIIVTLTVIGVLAYYVENCKC